MAPQSRCPMRGFQMPTAFKQGVKDAAKAQIKKKTIFYSEGLSIQIYIEILPYCFGRVHHIHRFSFLFCARDPDILV